MVGVCIAINSLLFYFLTQDIANKIENRDGKFIKELITANDYHQDVFKWFAIIEKLYLILQYLYSSQTKIFNKCYNLTIDSTNRVHP